ncbi:MAG TPA: hypothetical protein VJ813_17370 [Vicinamibacterales bacterium]|nr:hypothetical protein [Vicinamibacterales bacterium]
MSVALNKVDGIASVNVTLKRGAAHIELNPGNSVSLSQLRKIIKEAGYPTGDALISGSGTVAARGERLVLEVTGTPASFRVVPDSTDPAPLARLREIAGGSSPVSVDVTGTVAAPAAKQQGPDTLRLRSFTITP